MARLGPIGLDLGSRSFKAVQLQWSGGNWRIARAAMAEAVPYGDDGLLEAEQAALAINTLLQAGGFVGRRVVIAPSHEHSLVRVLTLPEMPAEEIPEAVRWEMEQHLHFPLDDAVIEYDLVSRNQEEDLTTFEIVAAAARRSVVLSLIEAVTAAGGKVVAVDLEVVAGARAIIRRDMIDKVILVADIGDMTTAVSIFDKGVLRLSRSLNTGMRDIQDMDEYEQVLAEVRQMSASGFDIQVADGPPIDPGALTMVAEEVNRSLGWYMANFRAEPDYVILHGGGAAAYDVETALAEQISVPVQVPDAAASVLLGRRLRVGLTRHQFACRFTVATGLGLKGAMRR